MLRTNDNECGIISTVTAITAKKTEGVADLPRTIPTVLTTFDLQRICLNPQPALYAAAGAAGAQRPDFTARLNGRELCFAMDDGRKLWYAFHGDHLSVGGESAVRREEYAECLASAAEGVYLIHHLNTGSDPCGASTLVYDEKTGLATLVSDTFNTVWADRDVNRTVTFGALDGVGTKERHACTDRLTGTVIDWKYAEGMIIHQLYENRSCCAFVSPPPEAAPEWSVFFSTFNPTKYVQIRENLLLLSFYAPGSSGMEVSALMDLDTMTQVGAVFGIDMTDALRSYTFGANGAWAEVAFVGRYTVE